MVEMDVIKNPNEGLTFLEAISNEIKLNSLYSNKTAAQQSVIWTCKSLGAGRIGWLRVFPAPTCASLHK
jgi:hypothetical protein